VSGKFWVALSVAAVCVVALAACGDDSGKTDSQASSLDPAAHKALARADANCREMLRDVRHLAKGVLSSGYHNTLELTTEGFAKPGMAVLRTIAKRQQALAPVVDDPRYDLYVGFFNPIIVLAEQRLRAGQAEDLATALNLQDRLTTLGIEQGLAASDAGLPACEVDFLDAMVRAASG
jgi:hypothetical protein